MNVDEEATKQDADNLTKGVQAVNAVKKVCDRLKSIIV